MAKMPREPKRRRNVVWREGMVSSLVETKQGSGRSGLANTCWEDIQLLIPGEEFIPSLDVEDFLLELVESFGLFDVLDRRLCLESWLPETFAAEA